MKSFLQFISESTDESIEGVHYSHTPHLTHLEGERSGTGIRGSEQKRLHDSDDSRIKNRVYFYNKTGHELPKAETGLGPHVHIAKLTNIYNPSTASEEQRSVVEQHKKKYTTGFHNPSNTFESAVLDSGYHGYTNAGMTVVMGQKKVPVKYHGKA